MPQWLKSCIRNAKREVARMSPTSLMLARQKFGIPTHPKEQDNAE